MMSKKLNTYLKNKSSWGNYSAKSAWYNKFYYFIVFQDKILLESIH